LGTISRKIRDQNVLCLIRIILKHHKTENSGKGMPLGNLTSQFFANVYLHELDHFVKHGLKAKYYIRYVDDFAILHRDRRVLEEWKEAVSKFLHKHLEVELHPEKSKIIPLRKGMALLGFRIFYRFRLLKKSNARRIWKRLDLFKERYDARTIERDEIVQSLEGWSAYAMFANTFSLRKKAASTFNAHFGSTNRPFLY